MKINIKNKIEKSDSLVVIGNFFNNRAKSLFNKKNEFLFYESEKYCDKEVSDYFIKVNEKCGIKELMIINSDQKAFSRDDLRILGAKIAGIVGKRKRKTVQVMIDGMDNNFVFFIQGFILGSYDFSRFKNEKPFEIKSVNFILGSVTPKIKSAINEAIYIGQASNFVKNLVNAPANRLYPETFANSAKEIAKSSFRIKAKILTENQIRKMGMDALYQVGKASSKKTNMIILEYKGGKRGDAPIVLVGKGITFDSGGMNLKVGGNISHMKFDMAGGATVLGIFYLLSKIKLPLNIVGIVPAAENMIDASVLKPNDIINSYAGKTIEVTNTDAEGRLILADGLAYGIKNYKPRFIVDIATLTGACITALGTEISGLLGNDEKIIDKIKEAGKNADEKIWQLPLDKKIVESLKGTNSDLVNFNPNEKAGTIMGAGFLNYFVGDTPWAHIDMGGSAWSDKEEGCIKKGATGRMLRLLWEFLRGQ